MLTLQFEGLCKAPEKAGIDGVFILIFRLHSSKSAS